MDFQVQPTRLGSERSPAHAIRSYHRRYFPMMYPYFKGLPNRFATGSNTRHGTRRREFGPLVDQSFRLLASHAAIVEQVLERRFKTSLEPSRKKGLLVLVGFCPELFFCSLVVHHGCSPWLSPMNHCSPYNYHHQSRPPGGRPGFTLGVC